MEICDYTFSNEETNFTKVKKIIVNTFFLLILFHQKTQG